MKKGNKLINIPLAPFRKGEQKLKAPSRRGWGCSAFTLVELIVVITILAILGTIGFMSFQSYTVYSRDVTRQSELSLIDRAIKIKQAEGGYAPMPENYVEITASGEVIGYQGEFTKKIGNRYGISGKLEDPLDGSSYVYSVDKNLDIFSVGAFMEGDEIANLPQLVSPNKEGLIMKTYAKDGRKLSVKGEEFGIILKDGEEINKIEDIKNNGLDILKTEDSYKIFFNNDSFLEGTGSYLGGFMVARTKNEKLIKLDKQGIAYFDFDKGIKDLFGNYSVENIGDLKVYDTDLGKGLYCDGHGRLVIGSGSTILGGRKDFSIYISYKVKKGDNSSYNIAFASYGITDGYNIKLQHNFTDIENPKFGINGNSVTVGIPSNQKLYYDSYNKVLLTSKNGKWLIINNSKILAKGEMTESLREDRLDGLGLCSRANGGYNLKGIIDKFYISKSGIDEKGVGAFYALFQ